MKKVSTTIRCIALFFTRANSATVPWTGGPEDTFFCGYKWDEGNCLQRQHCPSGRNEECEFHAEGQKCFANSPCDARYGDGSGWVPGKEYSPPMNSPSVPLTPRPTYTGVSDGKYMQSVQTLQVCNAYETDPDFSRPYGSQLVRGGIRRSQNVRTALSFGESG